MEDLLKKIEDQDAETILCEENLREKFNELLKHDFITIEEGKVVLTERGKIARKEGFHIFLKKAKKSGGILELPKRDQKRIKVIYMLSFLVLFLAFLLVVILHLLN